MKTIILFLIIPFAAISQHTGTFAMNGVIITRTDSTEISDLNGKRDTCRVTWLSSKAYRIEGRNGSATARIYESGAWGYRAKVTDGKRTVWVEAIRVKHPTRQRQ